MSEQSTVSLGPADQARGGVAANLNTTLTNKTKPLQTQGYPILSTVDTP